MRRALPFSAFARVSVRKAALLSLALLLVAGCNTPEGVAVFCAASSTTLTEAAPVLRDLGGSCLRAKNLEKDVATFDPVASDPACAEVDKQAEGAVAAAALLSRYFDALNTLAAVNTLKTGSDSSALVAEATAAFGANTTAQSALTSIAGFLTNAGTRSYQQKALARDLTTASANVATITDALTTIVQTNYLHQELGNEEQKLTVRYRGFAQQHPDGTVLLHLEERFDADHTRLNERRASAEALLTSLGTIKSAVANLAANPRSLKARQLDLLLKPYTEQLQTNLPEIQKAF